MNAKAGQRAWHMMEGALACVLVVLLFSFSMPALAETSPRGLMDKAAAYVASAPWISRIDTTEQTAVVIIGQQRMEQKPQENVLRIEIDRPRHLVRHTGMVQGKESVILKQGDKAAMKIGTGPWQVPTGPFEKMAQDMGDLCACEVETPETQENAPTLKSGGTEVFEGKEAFIIETEGNTAVPIAQERMTKGIEKAFSGNPEQRPTVKVLEYSARHWIGKADYRRLQAVQTSKYQMTLPLPDGKKQVVEVSSKATSKYSYEEVRIEVPEDAEKILSGGNP